MKVLMTIARLYKNYKPFGFFTILSVIMAMISTCFFVPVIVKFVQTGLVPNFPTLIVCCFVYLAAIIAFFAGVLLATISQKNRQDFEMVLQQCDREYKKLTK